MAKLKRILSSLMVSAVFVSSLSMSIGAVEPSKVYDKSQKVSLLGTTHTDIIWQWQQYETVCGMYDTFVDQLKFAEENPDYKYSHSAAKYFYYMKDYFPGMNEKLKAAYDKGQFSFNSGWVEFDTNIPSAEATIRQNMYAQKWYQDIFGAKATVMLLPDDYGHGWILPQICKGTGYNGMVLSRTGVLHPGLTRWKGVEGTELLTYVPVGWYCNTATQSTKADIKLAADLMKKLDVDKSMINVGMGDGGGGPTQTMINDVKFVKQSNRYPDAEWIVPAQYFSSLTDADLEKAAKVNQGLYYGVCTGSFSSEAEMKKYNRLGETGLASAEIAGSIADWLGASAYPVDKLWTAWEKIMTMQDHGTFTGSAIKASNDEIYNEYEISMNMINQSYNTSVNGIVSRADTTGNGVPLFIFNPLSVTRDEIVGKEVVFNKDITGIKVYDNNGKEVPVQVLSISGNKAKILFEAKKLPSVGYAVYRAVPVEKTPVYNTGLVTTDTTMENPYVGLTINPKTGNVVSIYDKVAKKELIEPGKEVELQLLKDDANSLDMHPYDLAKAPAAIVSKSPKITLVESGPLRSVIRVERKEKTSRAKKSSTYTQDIVLYSNSSRIDFPTTVDWQERATSLKVSFPTTASASTTTYDISNGTAERGINYKNFGAPAEVYGHMWADFTDTSGEYGFSVLNNCKYGWDMPSNRQLRLTLLRATFFEEIAPDSGVHSFTYSFYPHSGDWRQANTPAKAYELNYPVTVEQAGKHPGDLGKTYSFASLDQPNVIITALKPTEDSIKKYNADSTVYDRDLTFRLMETYGNEKTDVNLKLGFNIKSAAETNMLEEKTADAKASANTISTTVSKYQYRTFVVSPESPYYKLNRPNTVSVDLSKHFNVRAIASNNEKVDMGMGIKRAYPAELISDKLVSNDIPFAIGSTAAGKNNGISCFGQEVALPQGQYKKLFLLGAAGGDGKDYEEIVTVRYTDGTAQDITVKFDNWNKTVHWQDEYKYAPIAEAFTHYHYDGTDVIEDRVNLFSYTIPLNSKKTVKSVVLPSNEAVKILSATLGDALSPTSKAIGNNNDANLNVKENNKYVMLAKNNLDLSDAVLSVDPTDSFNFAWLIAAIAAVALLGAGVTVLVLYKKGKLFYKGGNNVEK